MYELRRHPESLRLTRLAAYCVIREQELPDTLVELLLDMVHRIFARVEERVEKKLQSDVRRVSGKQTLLFLLAEAAIAQPATATPANALRPSRWAISAKVRFSPSNSCSRPWISESDSRRQIFVAHQQFFINSSGDAGQ